MSSGFERNLEKYAEITVKIGLNLQAGQRLIINSYGPPSELETLVRLIVSKAYQVGARLVDVIWDDQQLELIRLQYAPRDSFEEYPAWQTNALYEVAKAGDAVLIILGHNPDLLNEQDAELVSAVQRAEAGYFKPFSELRSQRVMNCAIISAATDGWAQKVFPDLPSGSQKLKLWDTVFDICRVKRDDPVSAWDEHIKGLAVWRNYLNHKRYQALKLTAPGTDLTVGLPEGHIWVSGRVTSQNGIEHTANMPTEEVFTMPHKDKTEGVVTASKPLSRGGVLIEDFSLTFEKGRIVKAAAAKGEENLLKLLETDEGASRIGEVALVPHSSPISQSGLLFYNTLVDENASNHIALGKAYKFTMEGGKTMSDEEFAAAGGNDSLIHVDFMVGSEEMDVDGLTAEGISEPLMRGGEWAFEV